MSSSAGSRASSRLFRGIAPYVAIVVLCAALVAAPSPSWSPWDFEVTVPYTDTNDPFAPDALAERLARVQSLVEQVLGEPVDIYGLVVREADPDEEAERAFAREHPQSLDTTAPDYDPEAREREWLRLRHQIYDRVAWYDRRTDEILLVPQMLEALGVEHMDAMLDVVLAHELVHLWQDRAHRAFEREGAPSLTEWHLARAAVTEGTAEFVSREVAQGIGRLDAFEQLSAREVEHTVVAGLPTATGRWARWAYGDGLRFVQHVYEALGSRETWARLRASPPSTVYAIEHPDAWLRGEADPVFGLAAWSQRLAEAAGAAEGNRELGRTRLLPADLTRRLECAGVARAKGPWARCLGGEVVAGRVQHAHLPGVTMLVRLWQFPSPADADAAASVLRDATVSGGIRTWLGADTERPSPPRVRSAPGGACTYTFVGLVAAGTRTTTLSIFEMDVPAHSLEGSWGYVVEGSVVIEALSMTVGIAPALLEMLGLAAGLREPDTSLDRAEGPPKGEANRLAWLEARPDDAAAWIASLAPWAVPEDGATDLGYLLESPYRRPTDLGPLLEASLRHPDLDVRCYALGALADSWIRPAPFQRAVVDLIVEATRAEDVALRCAGLRAARTLEDDLYFESDDVERLVADPSPAVRTALASARGVLRRQWRHVLPRLERDPHRAVREAATPSPAAADEWGGLFDRARASDALAERVRDLQDPRARMLRSVSLHHGSFDLEPAREPLTAMLETPLWRTFILHILAANGLKLTGELEERLRAWTYAPRATVRAGAIALLLAERPQDEGLEMVARELWDDVPHNAREVLLRALLRHRPDADTTAELYAWAIRSWVPSEREGALFAVVPPVFLPRKVDLLLTALPEGGQALAALYWAACCRALADASEGAHEVKVKADRVLALHLHRWCEAGALPEIAADTEAWWGFPEEGLSGSAVAALDRALVRSEAPALRTSLARLRAMSDVEAHPESPAVQDTINDLLVNLVLGLDAESTELFDLMEIVCSRRCPRADQVPALLRRCADLDWGDLYVEDLIGGTPGGIEVGLKLVPELLEKGTTGSVEVALEIVGVAGLRARDLAPMLRARFKTALPSWRARLDGVLDW